MEIASSLNLLNHIYSREDYWIQSKRGWNLQSPW